MAPLLLVDASGLLYAAYHAIQNLTNREGQATNALFGFANSLNKLSKAFTEHNLVVVFDGPHGSAARRELDSAYKAHRPEMPVDLQPQIRWAQELCRLNGLPYLVLSGVEADDVIASIATWALAQGGDLLVCTNDKDLYQLVGPHLQVVNPRRDYVVIDRAAVEAQYGLPPELIADYLALVGDASDNIPSIPTFGPKTAAAALLAAGSLENLLAHPELARQAKKIAILREYADRIRLNRQLTTLNISVAFVPTPDHFARTSPDVQGLRAFYKAHDLHTLLRTLPTDATVHADAHLVADAAAWHTLAQHLASLPAIAIVAAATGSDPHRSHLIGLAFVDKPGAAWYLPLDGSIAAADLLPPLQKLLASTAIYSHDVKALSHLLRNYDGSLVISHIAGDTLLASELLYAHRRQHELPYLSEQYLHISLPKLDTGTGKKKVDLSQIPLNILTQYFCTVADAAARLHQLFDKELHDRQLYNLFQTLELPLLPILTDMEACGIYLDTQVLAALNDDLRSQLDGLTSAIYDLAGYELNLNSPQQLSQLLTRCGIDISKKTTLGSSTSAEELAKVSGRHPIVPLILQYRECEKLRSTYVEALPKAIVPRTQRIHCTFNQSATATGRLSCQDPNLQNIPIRTPLGKQIRAAFCPAKRDWSFLSADYSQVELRLLAHLSGDANLLAAFTSGIDIHRYTASLIFQIPPEAITPEQRSRTKAVNFGILYGQQAYALSQEIHTSIKEAEAFIDTYFDRYPSVKSYLDSCKDYTRRTGKAITICGRERIIPDIHSPNNAVRSAAERLAINTPIQGSAADLIKLAMPRVAAALRSHGLRANLLLQIHDELLFEAPNEELSLLATLTRDAMENALSLRVPLIVDISVGKNWLEC